MGKKIRCAIVEDEEQYRQMYRENLERYGKEHDVAISVEEFADGMDIMDEYRHRWDVIFLDVVMRHRDGFDAAQMIRKSDPEVLLVFITMSEQYAIRGYSVEAFDYILKPITYEQFSLHMDKIRDAVFSRTERYLDVPAGDGTETVLHLPVRSIRCLEVHHHTMEIHVVRGSEEDVYRLRSSMKEMEEKLSGCPFCLSDRNLLVNLSHVTKVGNDTVMLGDKTVPLARARRKDFIAALTSFLSSGTAPDREA